MWNNNINDSDDNNKYVIYYNNDYYRLLLKDVYTWVLMEFCCKLLERPAIPSSREYATSITSTAS